MRETRRTWTQPGPDWYRAETHTYETLPPWGRRVEDPLDQIDREMFEAVKWEHLFAPAAVLVTADEWRSIARKHWPDGPIPMPDGKRTYRGVDVLISAEVPERRVLLAPRTTAPKD